MPKLIKPLSDREIKTAKPKDKDYKLYDGKGLHLLVKKNGSKLFRMEFKFNSKSSTLSFGEYPLVSLVEARKRREDSILKIKNGIDPRTSSKKEVKTKKPTLNDVIDRWLELLKDDWSEVTYNKNKIVFDKNIYPYSGKMEIEKIKRKDIISDLNIIQERGANETANRLIVQLNRVFKYAVTNEIIEHNIIADIDKNTILKKGKNTHFPAVTSPKETKMLMERIKNYRNDFANDLGVAIALEIAPYLILRPSNLRMLEKTEIDFNKKYIFIEGNKMKNKEDFIMPFGSFVEKKLKEAISLDYRDSIYVFPSPLDANRPISDNTLNSALKRIGYKGKHTPHGFRSTFSTNAYDDMREHNLNEDVIESCLAHSDKNKIKSAYNRKYTFKYLEEKRQLLFWYENWLNNL